ncbi:MAG: DNA topoisomerase (ATP-hydrolyzing) subunit B [Bacilli bacterium]|nr:DNA topoisomerase (ATP-hydrolyzing) subunit B [Bacilli bacterium]MBQ6404622.1 DNA topoisomerase (ATP-hydrolyzing) subunit B [Bacilli bacterium]MBR2678741.1 DNA topoisomerase (ATP-hydrolyzing) subunit B [Bacilli bacterium]
MAEEKVKKEYDSSSIQVLEGLEAVRKRPGMYIGTTSSRGLHHLVWEIVDNAIDEALAGYCSHIEVTICKDNSIIVKDDGRGIPVEIHPKTGKSTVETVYTVLHAGGKFGGGGYKVSGGLHGVGASVVNALSEWLEVKVYRDGNVYYQRFNNGGHPEEDLKIIDKCDKDRTGTSVHFLPDPKIFDETTVYDYDILRTRLRELAFLNKGLRISLYDDREVDKKDSFHYEGGLIEYVNMLNKNKNPLHETVVYIEGEEKDIKVEVALQYNETYNSSIYSFVNNITTPEGGTHEDGVRRALTRILNKYATNNNLLKDKDEPLTGDDVREGITLIISIKHPNPQFEGQTKTKLGNSEVRGIADKIFSESFERFLLENPDQARIILEKSMTASRARVAAKKARELTRRKGDLDITNFFGKLNDCKSKDATISEIFLVEGDSAGGSAIKGRDAMTQAILPLRGKILNVEKARLDKALSNEEIRTIITAFGTGIGDEFDLSKLRYHKIIIMTDADVDGSHIRVLLLTLFYRFFRPIVEAGHVYAAQPPLYRITHGKTRKYVLDEAERDEYLASLDSNTKYEIARMKGLGEMDADELNETTMDINQRILRKITVEDIQAADEVFAKLMGEEVGPRREFIEENATYANLDV